jgi:hypothetical protein
MSPTGCTVASTIYVCESTLVPTYTYDTDGNPIYKNNVQVTQNTHHPESDQSMSAQATLWTAPNINTGTGDVWSDDTVSNANSWFIGGADAKPLCGAMNRRCDDLAKLQQNADIRAHGCPGGDVHTGWFYDMYGQWQYQLSCTPTPPPPPTTHPTTHLTSPTTNPPTTPPLPEPTSPELSSFAIDPTKTYSIEEMLSTDPEYQATMSLIDAYNDTLETATDNFGESTYWLTNSSPTLAASPSLGITNGGSSAGFAALTVGALVPAVLGIGMLAYGAYKVWEYFWGNKKPASEVALEAAILEEPMTAPATP